MFALLDESKEEPVVSKNGFSTPPAKTNEQKHSPHNALVFGSPREAELSNSLFNLKMGFRQR